MRALELNAAASVDPFAKAYAVITPRLIPPRARQPSVSRAALQTTSLPWNLELKAGRFFGEFGRLGYIHDHELPFVNRPLVLDEYIAVNRNPTSAIKLASADSALRQRDPGVGDHFGADSPNPDNPGTYRPLSGLNFWGRLSVIGM